MSKNIKKGVVAIIGKPNVGKSTLLNNLAKQKISITTKKPQTTRNKINFTYKDDNHHIIFYDTPGFHNPNNKLDLFLNAEIKKTLKIANLIVFLLDPTRDLNDEDEKLMKIVHEYKCENIIFCVNKTDMIDKKKLDFFIDKVNKKFNVKYPFIYVSSVHENNKFIVEKIANFINDDNERFVDEHESVQDSFFISEIIREIIILNSRQEIPYSIHVEIESEKYDKEKNVFFINANIIVEKESQKAIIIGSRGSMIKLIGTQARKELLKIYNCSIDLRLFVKVKLDWRNDINYLKKAKYWND